jgi:hypothetical protein
LTLYAKRDFPDEEEVHLSFASWQFDSPSSGPATADNTEAKTNTIDWGNFPTSATFFSASSIIVLASIYTI